MSAQRTPVTRIQDQDDVSLTGAPTRGDLLVGDVTGKWNKLAAGAVGTVLAGQGAGNAPAWAALDLSPYAQLAGATFTGGLVAGNGFTITGATGVLKATAGVVSGGATTTNLTEGTNLYYTQARFDTAFAAKRTSDLTESGNLYYTDARARAAHSVTGTLLAYNSGTGVFSTNYTAANVAGDTFTGLVTFTGRTLNSTAIPVTANYGSTSLGDGPFDGVTAGFFNGNATAGTGGTVLAINARSAFTGSLIDAEIAGSIVGGLIRIDNTDGGRWGWYARTKNGTYSATYGPYHASIQNFTIDGNQNSISNAVGTSLQFKANNTANQLGITATQGTFVYSAPNVTANYGALNIGDGLFSGAAGAFSGDATATNGGTYLAMNARSSFLGRLADFQINGVRKWGLDYLGIQYLGNCGTPPGSNPSSGGYLYVDAGALKYRGSGGTITPIAAA